MRLSLVLALALAACAHSAPPDRVRTIDLGPDGEVWRYAIFDAATRVLAQRGYLIRLSDRPNVLNTDIRGESNLLPDRPKVILSFQLQVTTTNVGVRIEAKVNERWSESMGVRQYWTTCSGGEAQALEADRAPAARRT